MITFNNITKSFSIDADTALFIRVALRAAAAYWMNRGFITTADDLTAVADRMRDLEEQSDD